MGQASAITFDALFDKSGKQQHLVALPEKEEAAYFYDDLEALLGEAGLHPNKKRVFFYPTTYKRPYEPEKLDKAYELSCTEVLKRFLNDDRKTIVVTDPKALVEKVITKTYLNKNMIKLRQGEEVSPDFLADLLIEFDFEKTDFVAEPGQFALHGGIVDVFSYANDHINRITLLTNVQNRQLKEERISFLDYLPARTLWWLTDV